MNPKLKLFLFLAAYTLLAAGLLSGIFGGGY
jgi:hypothetical protein